MPEIRPLAYDASIAALLARNRLPTDDLPRPDVHFLGAFDGARLDGCVAIETCGRDGLLRSLAVSANIRKTGLGSALVAASEDLACAQGLDALYLLTTDAANYFASRGYTVVERAQVPGAIADTAQFAGLCPASAIVMFKRLSGSVSVREKGSACSSPY